MTASCAADSHDRRTGLAIVVVYLVVQTALLVFSDPGCHELGARCHRESDRYGVFPAEALLRHGAFVDYVDPTLAWTKWPPGYPLFIAAIRTVTGGGPSLLPIVFVQFALLLGVGWIARSIARSVDPNAGNPALALVLLNPNMLAFSQLVAAEMLQAFLVAVVAAHILAFVAHPERRWLGIVSGGLLGLATLVRPSSQFLILLYPAALPLLQWVSGRRRQLLRSVGVGTAATALGLVVLAPWLSHQVNNGEGLSLVSRHTQHLYLLDNLRYLTREQPGELVNEYKAELWREETEHLDRYYPGWQKLPFAEESRLRTEFLWQHIRSRDFGLEIVVPAFVKAAGRFLVSGGEGALHRLFGIEYQPELAPTLFWGIKGIALAYSVVLKLLGLVGAAYLWRQRNYALLVLCVALVTYFLSPHPFFAHPRYRVPVELPFALLAAFGVVWLARLRGGRATVVPD